MWLRNSLPWRITNLNPFKKDAICFSPAIKSELGKIRNVEKSSAALIDVGSESGGGKGGNLTPVCDG